MLPHSHFWWNDKENKKLESWCIDCKGAQVAGYINENPGLNNFNSCKHTAKKSGLPFDIDMDYIKEIDTTDTCPMLGIHMSWGYHETGVGQGTKSGRHDSKSIDKIIPELGYVKGNVMIISGRANMIKSDASYQEILRIGNYLKNIVTKNETTN